MEQLLKCLVIDDDPQVNDYVCEMVRQTPFLQLAGTFDHAAAAIHELEQGAINLIILDINLPGVDGVTFAATLKDLPNKTIPAVILISGSPEYAIAGYKVDAIDYLVKPFSYDDFYKSVSMARRLLQVHKPGNASEYLFLKVEHDLVRVNIKDIQYLESLRDYV